MALLDAVLDLIQKEYHKKEPIWQKQSFLTQTDLDFLETECAAPSDFDPKGWRKEMLERFKKGTAPFEVRECEYGRIIAILDHNKQDIPWGLWARILRLYHTATPARIFLLATPYLRQFPKKSRMIRTSNINGGYPHITPTDINGGYTYHCNKETIMIYRAEDATRVLIHELQHATCLDHMEYGVDQVEAETEAWAELIYVALLSQGKRERFHELVQKQAEWMLVQNQVVKRHMREPKQFPWRYTIGKQEVWQRWGILPEHVPSIAGEATRSLRLTFPPSPSIKQLFGVHSTLL